MFTAFNQLLDCHFIEVSDISGNPEDIRNHSLSLPSEYFSPGREYRFGITQFYALNGLTVEGKTKNVRVVTGKPQKGII